MQDHWECSLSNIKAAKEIINKQKIECKTKTKKKILKKITANYAHLRTELSKIFPQDHCKCSLPNIETAKEICNKKKHRPPPPHTHTHQKTQYQTKSKSKKVPPTLGRTVLSPTLIFLVCAHWEEWGGGAPNLHPQKT